MKLNQIYETDLQTLEEALPVICEAIPPERLTQEVREYMEMSKTILSNVRWNYGPHTDVEELPQC